ncbi:MAG: hypothetical protein GAK32_01587 [Pseudomonas fluorescens]|nr:MAG: hypothetical protein GAK32_01587 [Pseudomonas fluorescens]
MAQHLGISAGSLYNHIESKEALLFELVEQLYLDLLDVVGRVLKSRTHPLRRLERLIVGHLELHRNKADYFRVAEQANTCLTPTHLAQLDTLRAHYEGQLLTLLAGLGLPLQSLTTMTTARSIAALLNHLPHRAAGVDLMSSDYVHLLKRMILGALDAQKNAP